jgi:hypothetical protein
VEDPVPEWSTETYQAITLAAAGAAGLCLLLLLLVLARLRVLSRRVRRTPPARTSSDGTVGPDPRALRHVAVVRYDAFGDMGGHLSFSAALLDDQGDGLVISSINGRSETRTYAKALVGLKSEHTLSPEEQDAIEAARTDS